MIFKCSNSGGSVHVYKFENICWQDTPIYLQTEQFWDEQTASADRPCFCTHCHEVWSAMEDVRDIQKGNNVFCTDKASLTWMLVFVPKHPHNFHIIWMVTFIWAFSWFCANGMCENKNSNCLLDQRTNIFSPWQARFGSQCMRVCQPPYESRAGCYKQW